MKDTMRLPPAECDAFLNLVTEHLYVHQVEAFKKQLDSVDSVSFSPKTFAATYKLALDHFKKEVSAGFVVFILKKLLDMHNIVEDDFKADLMSRYSTESPSLDKLGQHHFSSINNQLFKGTMDAAVSKSGTKASGVIFATEEVGQTAVEGLSKPMTAQAWFWRLQLDYATTRRDALGIRGTSELLMPKLTITEFKKANGFITFQTNNQEVNCQLNWWLTVIESRAKKVQEITHSDTVISASVTDIEVLTQPDMVYSSLSGGAVGAISDDMAKFLQAVRVLLLAYPIAARSPVSSALHTIKEAVEFLVLDLSRNDVGIVASLEQSQLNEDMGEIRRTFGDVKDVWKKGKPSTSFFDHLEGGPFAVKYLLITATTVFLDLDHPLVPAGHLLRKETAMVSAHLYNVHPKTFLCDDLIKVPAKLVGLVIIDPSLGDDTGPLWDVGEKAWTVVDASDTLRTLMVQNRKFAGVFKVVMYSNMEQVSTFTRAFVDSNAKDVHHVSITRIGPDFKHASSTVAIVGTFSTTRGTSVTALRGMTPGNSLKVYLPPSDADKSVFGRPDISGCSIGPRQVGNMEGNWDMLKQSAAEKPIVIKGTGTYKRTFPLDHITGKVLIRGAASVNEVLLEQSSGKYTGIKLMRGLWEEPTGHSSGTFFPVAAPAGVGVLWGSAGHCLMPASVQQKWRCGYGTDVLPSSLSIRPVPRAIVDLGWLTSGRNISKLAEHIPSQPSQRIGEAEFLPDFGFMVTKAPEGGPMQLFIPSARKLVDGDAVCVLGFAHRLTAEWAQRFLRTEADYEQAADEAELLGHQLPAPADWRLDGNLALRRALDLEDDVCYPSRLVVSSGLVAGASHRIIEHTCSTFPGMSGGPGVDVQTPWQLMFVHTRADADFRRNNYGYSVHHPLFVKAYEREVLPRLLATSSDLLSKEMMRCLHGYLDSHKDQLADQGVLHQVEKRC
eukprot:gene1186-biopygen14051